VIGFGVEAVTVIKPHIAASNLSNNRFEFCTTIFSSCHNFREQDRIEPIYYVTLCEKRGTYGELG
jgi:hypothetical protein